MIRTLVLVVCALLLAGPLTAQDNRPNIVVIIGDDMGYGDIGLHGCQDIPTPNIDAFAKAGVRCTNGYVSGPYCSPTRAGLLTGRYQQRFGHEFNPGPNGGPEIGLPLTETTFVQRLKDAGYRTGLVGKWHLGSAEKFHPMKRGFEEYFGFLQGAHPYFPGGPAIMQRQAANNNQIMRGTTPVRETEYLTDAIAREATAFIAKHKADPFCLVVAFNAVHTPLQAPDELVAKFPNIDNERRKTYAAMMTGLDNGVGKIMAKIVTEGLEAETLVFFISDNGGPAANGSRNGSLRGFKAQTFEGGVRVPFLAQWKGVIPAARVVDHPLIQLDIAATALTAAGVKTEGLKLDGVDILPALAGKVETPPHDRLYWRFGRQMAIRQGSYKLVRGPGANAPAELFDLSLDIGEKNNLVPSKPELTAELTAAWDKWNSELVAPKWGPPAMMAPPAAE